MAKKLRSFEILAETSIAQSAEHLIDEPEILGWSPTWGHRVWGEDRAVCCEFVQSWLEEFEDYPQSAKVDSTKVDGVGYRAAHREEWAPPVVPYVWFAAV